MLLGRRTIDELQITKLLRALQTKIGQEKATGDIFLSSLGYL